MVPLYSRYFEHPEGYSVINLQVWPVIHIRSTEQALRNAARAEQAGCPGVFLIHMEGDDDLIDPIAEQIRVHHAALSIGVNYLSLGALDSLERSLARGWDATWSDRPGVRSDGLTDEAKAIGVLLGHHKNHAYFGSVAFKYQPVDPHPAEAARMALALGMIPTTSGTATGSAPQQEKLAGIRTAIGEGKLAVASGITPENLHELGPFLSHVLVSTGIGRDFYEIDPDKLAQLMAEARKLTSARTA